MQLPTNYFPLLLTISPYFNRCLTEHRCRGLLCNVETEASFSKLGFEIAGALTASADPNFFVPAAEITVEGCVELTFGCPSSVCKRAAVRNRVTVSLAEICVAAGAKVLECQLAEFDECEQAPIGFTGPNLDTLGAIALGKCPVRHRFLKVRDATPPCVPACLCPRVDALFGDCAVAVLSNPSQSRSSVQ